MIELEKLKEKETYKKEEAKEYIYKYIHHKLSLTNQQLTKLIKCSKEE